MTDPKTIKLGRQIVISHTLIFLQHLPVFIHPVHLIFIGHESRIGIIETRGINGNVLMNSIQQRYFICSFFLLYKRRNSQFPVDKDICYSNRIMPSSLQILSGSIKVEQTFGVSEPYIPVYIFRWETVDKNGAGNASMKL